MSEAAEISEVISAIYDAAIDARCWSSALQKTCAYAGGHSSLLISQDYAEQNWRLHHWGFGDKYAQLYLQHEMIESNPTRHRVWSWQIGDVHAGHELVDDGTIIVERYLTSPFFKEWQEPLGFAESIQVVLDKTSTALARLAVNFGDGPPRAFVNEEMLGRMRLLVPHFRRAALIAKLLQKHDARSAVLSCVLDQLTTAVVLVGADRALAYTNQAGELLFSGGVIARDARGALRAGDAAFNTELQSALAAACGGDLVLGTKGIALPFRTMDGEHYVAHVLALSSTLRRNLNGAQSAAAALFFHKAEMRSRISGEVLTALYGLTPAELRVLMAVVDIGNVREIAAALQLSEATVRTHLSHLFDKTQTSRQAELVKLVASFSNQIST